MLVKTDALVLRNIKYGDNKQIVDMFTRDYGRMSFIVTLTRSSRAKVRRQQLQTLSLINITADLRPKTSLHRLTDVSVAVPYRTLPFDPCKLSIAMFVAEFLCHALRGEQRNEPLFLYISDSLRWLDGCQNGGYANFHAVFLLRLSRFLGFYPNLDDYHEGDFFDLRTGCFCHVPPLHGDTLPPADAGQLSLLMRMDYATMRLFRLSRAERNRLIDMAVRYYTIHIPDFPELKSLAVLRELFN